MKRLLIRPGAIGDVIVSLPALESLRTDATEIWAPAAVTSLVRLGCRVRSLQETGLDWLELPGEQAPPRLVESLREFDSIVSWYGSNRDEFREAADRLGLPVELLPALPSGTSTHAVDFYLAQAIALGGRPVVPTPRIRCEACPGEYAVIHPFSGSAGKNWPLKNFEALARHLEPRLAVEWTAGPGEILSGARRFDDLYDLATWLAGARLYVGNDSGISHLAAAVGTPAVVIFGPTDPRVWAPRGSDVRVVAALESDVETVAGIAQSAIRR
jgi:ADP-heptose:LPS heptosyltransferase